MVDPNRGAELDQALELMHFGFRKLVEEPDRILERRGLGRVHHRILYFVRSRAGPSVGELLHILGVTKQALHRPLRQLSEQGLVSSEHDPHDRRIRRLRLTPAGTRLEARISGNQRKRFQRIFESSGPEAERGWRLVMEMLGGRKPGSQD
jgi:DNA-binding MarR family transcriptional regulator